ncbi:hypothetical protein ACJX0J_037927, partial [Zea mays]
MKNSDCSLSLKYLRDKCCKVSLQPEKDVRISDFINIKMETKCNIINLLYANFTSVFGPLLILINLAHRDSKLHALCVMLTAIFFLVGMYVTILHHVRLHHFYILPFRVGILLQLSLNHVITRMHSCVAIDLFHMFGTPGIYEGFEDLDLNRITKHRFQIFWSD